MGGNSGKGVQLQLSDGGSKNLVADIETTMSVFYHIASYSIHVKKSYHELLLGIGI